MKTMRKSLLVAAVVVAGICAVSERTGAEPKSDSTTRPIVDETLRNEVEVWKKDLGGGSQFRVVKRFTVIRAPVSFNRAVQIPDRRIVTYSLLLVRANGEPAQELRKLEFDDQADSLGSFMAYDAAFTGGKLVVIYRDAFATTFASAFDAGAKASKSVDGELCTDLPNGRSIATSAKVLGADKDANVAISVRIDSPGGAHDAYYLLANSPDGPQWRAVAEKPTLAAVNTGDLPTERKEGAK